MKRLVIGLITITILVLSVLVFLFFTLTKTIAEVLRTPTPTPIQVTVTKDGLWKLIQEWRVSQGYEAYEELPALCDIANKRVVEAHTEFSHDKFYVDYKTFPSVINENLSIDYNNEDTLKGWLASLGHRKQLERKTKYSCLAVKDNVQVQIFSNCENGCFIQE